MSKSTYSHIVIIYNPNSTGGQAKQKANKLAKRLQKHFGHIVETKSTSYAGHAEEIAYAIAKHYKHPLIISVSGDGGYNEVINGALHAQNEKAGHKPVCAIMAAGNANDHRRTVRKRPLSWALTHSTPEPIDVLKLTFKHKNATTTRYAHSYIGFGLTSQAAAELNREHLTPLKEVRIVLETLLNFKTLRIIDNHGSIQKLDSLVFANIHHMSKVLRIGKKTNLHNGLFRVASIPHRTRIRLFFTLLSIAIVGFRNPPQHAAYKFTIPGTELAHLDGEVITVPGGAAIHIESDQEKLLTIR